jgi:hypothetical protein
MSQLLSPTKYTTIIIPISVCYYLDLRNAMYLFNEDLLFYQVEAFIIYNNLPLK